MQGEREMARDNWELGSFEVSMEKAPKGQARVGVQFRIDADGILEVLARDTSTGKDVVVNIESSAVNVDDAAATWKKAVDAGYKSVMEPERLERWPVVVGFVLDPDGYLIEIIQHDGPPPGE